MFSSSPTKQGLLAGITAFCIWGLLPLYWKALYTVGPFEILCHRILWSFLFLSVLLLFLWRGRNKMTALFRSRDFFFLLLSSCLIGINWLLYIWAVNTDHILECSLGYYINPLVNVLLGFLFFQDKLRPLQWLAVFLACCGVFTQLIEFGRLPWITLALAFSFGFYGLSKKFITIDSVRGLLVETGILSIPALFFITSLMHKQQDALSSASPAIIFLLVGAGIVTAVPLLLFGIAIKRLTLATLGIIQYIAPSGMFLLGVLLYNEPFPAATQLTFLFIWSGVVIYAAESFVYLRKAEKWTIK